MKNDYNKQMKEIISCLECKPKLLLHSCCAPCSSSVIEKLEKFFDLTIFYYNPNIFPKEEYEKRRDEQIKFLKIKNIGYIIPKYQHADFLCAIKGKESLGEKSERCKCCYFERMKKCAEFASENCYDWFCTTLSVSPHKNSEWINEIGSELSKKYNINFLHSDFKKENGFLRSLELSKQNNFYRQDYCGCEFSKKERMGE